MASAPQSAPWLAWRPLAEVKDNNFTAALLQAEQNKAQALTGLAGAAFNQAAAADLRRMELKAIAKENERTRQQDRRMNFIRTAGSLPGLTPPSMYSLTGLGDSQNLLGLLDRNTLAYYNLLKSGVDANGNTPALALPNS